MTDELEKQGNPDLDDDLDELIACLETKIARIRPQVERSQLYLAQLERQLDENKALRAGVVRYRFASMSPGRAAQQVLRERGEPMSKDELTEILVEAGCAKGKTNQVQSVGAGISQTVNRGTLVEKNGKIWLPEWVDDPAFE